MPGVRTIWQKVVKLPIWKVNEVVHGAQGAELVIVMSSASPFLRSRLIGKGKESVQRRFEGFALTRRYVVCREPIAAREHFLADFGEGRVVGRMGRMHDEEMTSFGCVEGGNMSMGGFYHRWGARARRERAMH